MEHFQSLQEKARAEYKEMVKQRFYTMNGQLLDEETVERIIETGESESVLQKAKEEQDIVVLVDALCGLAGFADRHHFSTSPL